MQRTLRILATTLVAVVSGGLGLAATPANASPPAGAHVATMKRIGVNHEIAAAHGYEVRVDDNGVEYAVKKGVTHPMNTVSGGCGTSWVYFTAVDTKKHYSSVYTGFELSPGEAGAVYVDWSVSVTDDYGVSHWAWHDPAASVHFWAKTHGFTASGATTAYADVQFGSITTLWDGEICYSYGPTASARL